MTAYQNAALSFCFTLLLCGVVRQLFPAGRFGKMAGFVVGLTLLASFSATLRALPAGAAGLPALAPLVPEQSLCEQTARALERPVANEAAALVRRTAESMRVKAAVQFVRTERAPPGVRVTAAAVTVEGGEGAAARLRQALEKELPAEWTVTPVIEGASE